MAEKRLGRVRWVALGLIMGLVAAWGAFGMLGATSLQPSVTTCTKASTGKMKVIAAADSGKCTKNGKGTTDLWDNHVFVANKIETICNDFYFMYNAHVAPTNPVLFGGFEAPCAGKVTLP
jgi:hypothetical protein